MAVNLKELDPAVVAVDKAKVPPPAPVPKKEIPVSVRIVENKAAPAEEGQDEPAPRYEIDFSSHCLVSTIDSKVLSFPRSLAAKVPVVAPILADQAADDHTPIPIGTNATAAIAIAHWIEHVGSASGKNETPMPGVCLYTEMSSFLNTEWEKDFDQRLLTSESETLLRVTNFAEQNGMIGLLDFCVIAISCAIRGKSNHEMMVNLCVDGDEMAEGDLEAGKASYPWINEITKPHLTDE